MGACAKGLSTVIFSNIVAGGMAPWYLVTNTLVDAVTPGRRGYNRALPLAGRAGLHPGLFLIHALGIVLAAFLAPLPGFAESPALINYQGRLAEGTNLFNGSARLQFHLYTNAAGGSAVFSSTNLATVADGVFSTLIGQHVTAGSLSEALTNRTVWLEVSVNGTTLTPRERLVSAPYALKVHGLNVIDANSIAPAAARRSFMPDPLCGAIHWTSMCSRRPATMSRSALPEASES